MTNRSLHSAIPAWILKVVAIVTVVQAAPAVATAAAEDGTLPPTAAATTLNCNLCFGIVAEDGSLIAHKGVKSVTHSLTGAYLINFARPVTNCAFMATLFASPVSTILSVFPFTNTQVEVDSRSPTTNAAADSEFSVAAICQPS